MQWYTPIHERFARYCASRTLGVRDRDDIMQDAILSALEQWPSIEQKDRLLGYMIGIVNHRMHNQLRSATVHRRFLVERRRELTDRLPARSAELALELDELLRAVDALPEAQREALLLQAVSGFGIREIAAIQHVSEAAVKTRISRARARLRARYAAEDRRTLSDHLRLYATLLL